MLSLPWIHELSDATCAPWDCYHVSPPPPAKLYYKRVSELCQGRATHLVHVRGAPMRAYCGYRQGHEVLRGQYRPVPYNRASCLFWGIRGHISHGYVAQLCISQAALYGYNSRVNYIRITHGAIHHSNVYAHESQPDISYYNESYLCYLGIVHQSQQKENWTQFVFFYSDKTQ